MLEPFSARPFCDVDSLILSWITYMHPPKEISDIRSGKGVEIRDLFRAEYFEELFHGLWDPQNSRRLLTAMAASPRFRHVRVKLFTEQFDPAAQKQFSAMSFQLDDLCACVAFRGTDSTFVGWKEDFNMAFMDPVPSQLEACDYLNAAASSLSGELFVSGHSKGGNLAVYAAVHADPDVQKRIRAAFSHDGPGFLESVLRSEAFVRMTPKIQKTLPQSSLIGMLLQQQEKYRVVKSNRVSIWQHDPFSWEIRDGEFFYQDRLTAGARYLDSTLNHWIVSMTAEERERLVDLLYRLVDTEQVMTVDQFKAGWQQNLPALLSTVSHMDEREKEFLARMLKELGALGVKNFPALFSEIPKTSEIAQN